MKRLPSIRTYLMMLVAVALIPMLAIGTALIWRQSSLRDRELDETLSAGAEALSLAVDGELESYVKMLDALAQIFEFEHDDLRAFHTLARRTVGRNGILFVSMFGPDRHQVLNTAIPYGAALPQPFHSPSAPDTGPLAPDLDSIARVFSTRAPTYSRLFNSLSLKRIIFTVNIPVVRQGEVAYVLNVGVDPGIVGTLLTRETKFGGRPASVLDTNGLVVAGSLWGGARVGRRAPIAADRSPDGVAVTTGDIPGGQRVAIKRSSTTGWQSVMAVEPGTVAELQRNLAIALGLLCLGTLVALLSARALTRRMRMSVKRLETAAQGVPDPDRNGATIREFSLVEASLRKLAETQQSEAEERARRLVADLQRQQAELENRRKDLYLATLAHELRNPLAPIRNAVTLLRRKAGDPNLVAWSHEIIERQVAQMARLLDDLLDVARIAQGKVELRLAIVDLRDAIANAVETAQPALHEAQQRLDVDVPPRPVWVNGDETRLVQIFANLLGNAAKYGRPHGRVRIALHCNGDTASVLVKDSGVGIAPELVETIFDPFVQAKHSPGHAQGGLGIGLALVRGLAQLHGGSVVARSDGPGKGAEFLVTLPICRHLPDFAPTHSESEPVRLDAAKILVVDDNVDNAETLAEVLRMAGATVEVAHDGFSAIEVAKAFRADAALLDIGMPGMSGHELAAQFSQHRPRPALIAISGWGQDADREAARKAGFDAHLTKPVDPPHLLQTLTRLLDVQAPASGAGASTTESSATAGL